MSQPMQGSVRQPDTSKGRSESAIKGQSLIAWCLGAHWEERDRARFTQILPHQNHPPFYLTRNKPSDICLLPKQSFHHMLLFSNSAYCSLNHEASLFPSALAALSVE